MSRFYQLDDKFLSEFQDGRSELQRILTLAFNQATAEAKSDEVLAKPFESGQFGMSIATSLALEGLFGIHPDKENQKDQKGDYDNYYINIYTLFRNVFGALSTKAKKAVLEKEAVVPMVILLDEDINKIVNTIAYNRNITLTIYRPDYDIVSQLLPNANIKLHTTALQRAYKSLLDRTINKFEEVFKLRYGLATCTENKLFEFYYTPFRSVLPKFPDRNKSIFITSYPFDILTRDITGSIKEFVLLESHTGNIKSTDFHTKLSVKDSTPLPFNHFTLQVFGDGNVISPRNIKTRRLLLEAFAKHRITTVSTLNKIKLAVMFIKDADVKKDLLNLLEDGNKIFK